MEIEIKGGKENKQLSLWVQATPRTLALIWEVMVNDCQFNET